MGQTGAVHGKVPRPMDRYRAGAQSSCRLVQVTLASELWAFCITNIPDICDNEEGDTERQISLLLH